MTIKHFELSVGIVCLLLLYRWVVLFSKLMRRIYVEGEEEEEAAASRKRTSVKKIFEVSSLKKIAGQYGYFISVLF